MYYHIVWFIDLFVFFTVDFFNKISYILHWLTLVSPPLYYIFLLIVVLVLLLGTKISI